MKTSDALDEIALRLREAIIGCCNMAKGAQDGLQLSGLEYFEVHAPRSCSPRAIEKAAKYRGRTARPDVRPDSCPRTAHSAGELDLDVMML